eukprot:758988-Hanusia_phi.AAC.2
MFQFSLSLLLSHEHVPLFASALYSQIINLKQATISISKLSMGHHLLEYSPLQARFPIGCVASSRLSLFNAP